MVLDALSKNRIIGRITASAAILGTLGATFWTYANGILIPDAGYALIGAIISGAATFLFMDETQST